MGLTDSHTHRYGTARCLRAFFDWVKGGTLFKRLKRDALWWLRRIRGSDVKIRLDSVENELAETRVQFEKAQRTLTDLVSKTSQAATAASGDRLLMAELSQKVGEAAELLRTLEACASESALQGKETFKSLRSIKQTANMIATRQIGVIGRIRCLFLIHHIEAWDSLADIVATMAETPEFDPIVATIPRRFPGMTDYGDEDFIHRRLKDLNVPHIRLAQKDSFEALDIIKIISPAVIFRQSNWEPDVPPAFSYQELRFARLCYVPYEMTSMVKNEVLFEEGGDLTSDSPFHKSCWRIFCASDLERKRLIKDGARIDEQVVVSGHPKAVRLLSRGQKRPCWPIESGATDSRGYRVIWACHHSLGEHWFNFGMFHRVCEEMLEWAKVDSGIEFVFQPHPALFSVLTNSGYMTEEVLEDWKNRWERLHNTAIFEGGDYGPIFGASDALITDGISFLAEYQLFQKPLIYLERRDHKPFSEVGERARQGFHSVQTVVEARYKINSFRSGTLDPLAEKQREFGDWLLEPGLPAKNIVENIRMGFLHISNRSHD